MSEQRPDRRPGPGQDEWTGPAQRSAPRARGRGRHVADKRTSEWDWEVSLPPAAPGATPVMQPPETIPTGIDLSDLARTAYAEHVAAAGPVGPPGSRPYPSRRSLRAAGAGISVDELPRPPGGPGGPGGPAPGGVAGDAEASGAPTVPGARDGQQDAAGAGSTAAVMRSSALMAAGTLVSRILGMARAIVVAWAIGLELVGDTFTTANTIPNNLYILIAGGALNAVLVPQISRAMKRGEPGREYVDRLLSMSVVILGLATLLITAAAPLLVLLYSDKWGPEQLALGVAFAFWCLPQVFFYGLYTLLGQVLNARGSFGPYMWAPVVNNVVAILGVLCFVAVAGADPKGDQPMSAWSPGLIALFAGTATLGVASQALVLVPVLRRSGFTFRFRWGLRGVGLGTASTVAGWTFAAVLVAQLGYIVASKTVNAGGVAAATNGGKGAGRIIYDSAYLIFVLPHSLVAVSLVTAIFTRMSRAAADGRRDDVRADLSLGLRTVGIATVLAAAGFLVLARDLAFVMFGASTREQTDVIGWTATAMGIGLVAYSAQYLAQRVFYAYEDAKTPFGVQLVQTLVWVAGVLLVRWQLDGAQIVVGAGAALAFSLVVGATMSLAQVRVHLGGVGVAQIVRTHVRLVVGAALAAVAGWSVKVFVLAWLGQGAGAVALGLVVAGLVMVVVYAAVLKVLQVRELDDLVEPFVGRLRRR